MLAGERMTGDDGVEVCLFPMDYMYCTQVSGPTSSSHCCGHPCDWIGPHEQYPVYAPFTGHVVARGQGTANTLFYSSDNPVRTPSGDMYVSIQLTHANYGSIPTKSHFNQGELLYYTGRSGQYTTGDHVHIDQCPGQNKQWIYYGITCSYGNSCYALPDSREPNQIFFIDGRETLAYLHGMNFIIGDGTPVIGPTGDSAKMLLLMAGKRLKERRRSYGKRKYTGWI